MPSSRRAASHGEEADVARVEDLVLAALKSLPPKPDDSASQAMKRHYSEQMSAALAPALAEELRHRGMREALPAGPGEVGPSGAERRLAGGVGAKKVDVTWSTEESGLLLGISVKTISFRDRRTNNFQKNLTNRRGEMLFESVTLHRRFPYAVLVAMLFLDQDAQHDGTERRRSTFANAFPRLRLFTGRSDPAGRDEQYERFYVLLVDANPFSPSVRCFHVSDADREVSLEQMMDDLVGLIAERNFDLYEDDGAGGVRKV
jgi:hypothetical protein